MPRRTSPVAARAGLACAGALLLAGCASGAGAGPPTWVPKPSFQGEGGATPSVGPGPQLPGGGAGGTPNGPGGSAVPGPSSTDPNASDPAVVATKLRSPVGLTLMPDGTALVGERTTGRIVRVQPKPGQPVTTVRTLSDLDASGDGGLLDLALSPTYTEDGLIFAYLTTRADNRVVTFTLTGPVTPVVTGIPKGNTGNAGRIAFAGGVLYIGTGDVGRPALAADPKSLAGKVLRVTDIGRPAPGNPSPSSPVFTRGHHGVAGLCPTGADDVLETEIAGADGLDEVNVLRGGADYGWPTAGPASQGPLTTLPTNQRTPGGCAVLDGMLYVTSLDGRALLSSQLTNRSGAASAGAFTPMLVGKYGRLRTVVPDPQGGALWLTTSNRDGKGRPVADDERVLRIVPSGGGAGSFPG